MSRLDELKQDVYDYEAAEITAGSLRDINALKEQAIRSAFEKNYAFFNELKSLYRVVQAQSLLDPSRPKKHVGNQVLIVAITSNKHFFGALIRNIIESFIAQFREHPDAKGLVIGSVGWQFFEQLGNTSHAEAFAFAEDMPNAAELQELFARFDTFDRIYVLYPKFINTFRQDVAIEDITQTPTDMPEETPSGLIDAEGAIPGASRMVAKDEAAAREASHFIFEPGAETILNYFDTQVRRVLFSRVMLESELSRTAARLMRMTEAQERAQHLAGDARNNMRHESAALSNMALLETFAGFTNWNRV